MNTDSDPYSSVESVLISIYKTLSQVSTDAASNRAGACRRANTDPRGASSPATSYRPRATSPYRQKYRPAHHPAQQLGHAPPGASSAFPRSDPDAPETSCSDVLRRPSTRSRCGPVSPSPSTVVDLRQSVSTAPCDDYTRRCRV